MSSSIENMILHKRAFPGRLIFDHLPKTAGQAINDWLISELGTGCVTPNLIGDHSDLIRKYGGLFSIISAHIEFNDNKGLDPRYQYITLFRNPIDRVVSWLFFVINNHEDSQIPVLKRQVMSFLNNEDDLSLKKYISNAYVEHFCRIEGLGTESDEKKVENAFSAIKKYDVVGVYEEMPLFLSEVASLIGLPEPKKLRSVNVTTKRPQVNDLSLTLHERITALNQLDLRLFEKIANWKKSTSREKFSSSSDFRKHQWEKFERINSRAKSTPDVFISSASLREGDEIKQGQLITIDIEASLTRDIPDLEIGFHILDSEGKCAFETNSTLLDQAYKRMKSGYYKISHHIIADLPSGSYTAGFSFAEKFSTGLNYIYWRESMCEFEVLKPEDKPFIGYSYLPAGISLVQTKIVETQPIVTNHSGHIRLSKPLENTVTGQLEHINVEIFNSSDQSWAGDTFRPINLSYHWLDNSGEMFLFDGLRTAIPTASFDPNILYMAEMQVKAPREAGMYTLIITLVQEMVGWFEENGFQAARCTVKVNNPNA